MYILHCIGTACNDFVGLKSLAPNELQAQWELPIYHHHLCCIGTFSCCLVLNNPARSSGAWIKLALSLINRPCVARAILKAALQLIISYSLLLIIFLQKLWNPPSEYFQNCMIGSKVMERRDWQKKLWCLTTEQRRQKFWSCLGTFKIVLWGFTVGKGSG